MDTKVCSKCKEEKSVEEFGRKKTSKDGLRYKCKECRNLDLKSWRVLNKEKVSGYRRKYRDSNAEKTAERKHRYYTINKVKITERMRKYRVANKERLAEYNRNYEKGKRLSDNSYRLRSVTRSRQKKALKKVIDSKSTIRDMGCTAQEACSHLESLFDENMTWENWGSYWQLDHIFPLAKANMKDRVEYLAVWNWRNLQPLMVEENRLKSDTVTPAAQELFDSLCSEFA